MLKHHLKNRQYQRGDKSKGLWQQCQRGHLNGKHLLALLIFTSYLAFQE
jgi:hypothetical protein